MSYCTLADLVLRYGEVDIRQLSERVIRPPLSINEAAVGRAIDEAAAEINLYLEARYTLPLSAVPLSLNKMACTLAYANLHVHLKPDSPVLAAADLSRRQLAAVAAGKISLGPSDTGTQAQTGNLVQFIPGRKPSKFD